MLEVIVLIYLSKKIGKIAEARGHKRGPNIVFFVGMWIACELVGAALGIFLFKGNIIPAYILAIIGAVIGTVISFNIVQNLEDKSDNNDIITIEID